MLLLVVLVPAVALAVGALPATFIMVTVRGLSMTPTLQHGDRVLVLRTWAARRLRRGDVVIAKPRLPGGEQLWIKRVAAVRGDRAVSRDEELVLSEREVFLVGDHEAGSFDSRQYGAVSTDDIIGRVVHHFPAHRGITAAA
jgi:signal peptidase I